MKNWIKSFAVLIFSAIFFTGCGGGGGSSSSTTNTDFLGNAVEANATIANGEAVSDVVVSDDLGLDNPPAINNVATTETNTILLSNHISKFVKDSLTYSNMNTNILNATIDETYNCSTSGSMNISGSGDVSAATFTMELNQCNNGSVAMNGTIKVIGGNPDADDYFQDVDITFTTDLTVGNLGKFYKGSSIVLKTIDTDKYTYDLSYKVDVVGSTFTQIGSHYVFEDLGAGATSIYQTKGKIGINDDANYVTFDETYDMSATPFVFDMGGTVQSGTAQFIMANGAILQVRVIGVTGYVFIDADVDGDYELYNAPPV